MKKLLLILLLSPLFLFSQWNQIGLPIYGEATFDLSGTSISLSTDGNILAIGAPLNDGNGSDSGNVRIYKNLSGVWTQIGSDINGEGVNDHSGGTDLVNVEGAALSLNSNGSVVAIGAHANDGINGADSGHVRVFENISGTWVQVGQDIDGLVGGESFGMSVDLNAAGTILAIGAPFQSGGGLVRVYELNSSSVWIQRGSNIIAEAAADFFGGSVSLNATGDILAIGGRANDGNGQGSGHVRVYSYSTGQNKNSRATGTWAQLGSDINGEAMNDASGSAVSINANGNIIAIGAKYNISNGYGFGSGHVRIFERISNVWTQIGSDINSLAQGDEFGYSVSLSSSGTRLAVGSRLSDANGNNSGQVRIFDNISGVWTQVYNAVNGDAGGDEFGTSVCLSGDGSKFAAGAPWNSSSISIAGQVRVFQDPALLSTKDFQLNGKSVLMYPNPTKNNFQIESKETLTKVEIYSFQGQSIKSFAPQSQYDISNLSSGLYLVKIRANNGEITKRIIKE